MTYQVLARSWRPQRFEEILGQEAVVTTLQNALSSDSLGHAYLFSGLRGVGKTTAARLLAKAVNCVEGPTAQPCGVCVSCREIADGASLDAVELDAATHTGVDDVRDLQELLRFRPSRDRYRVVIVDEVHMLSKAAFNALLKSIEEPPPYVLWVFATTERHKVPATILSRCQQLEFRPVAAEIISKRLLQIADHDGFRLDRSAAETIARAAEGSVRDALSLLDQLRAFASDQVDDEAVATVLGVPRFEAMVDLIGALAAGDGARALELLGRELAAGHDATVLYREAGRVLRTAVHLALDPKIVTSLTDEQKETLTPLVGDHGADAVSRMLGLWVEHEPLLRDSANRELALEVASLRLARWPSIRRLEEMLAGGGEIPDGSPARGGSQQQPPPPGESGPAPPTDPGARLASALWQGHPRLASVVERAQVTVADGEAVLRFGSDAAALAEFARSDELRQPLAAACRETLGTTGEVRFEVEGESAADGDAPSALAREADDDPELKLAQKVLGGQVVAVRPDREAP
jgi:DNA polymerase-3 subunit gamma/tau